MTEEKRKLLDKINGAIRKKKEQLLKQLPIIHKIDDGVIIRFFTDWDNCNDNADIKYKKIVNQDNPKETLIFFYLPKGAFFEMKKREYINSIICLSGSLEIETNTQVRYLEKYSKVVMNNDIFQGKATENTYLVTSNL